MKMKMNLYCHSCDLFYPIEIEINERNIYELECFEGHKTTCLLNQRKFEILYEIGAYALIDGYTREAVSSFAVAVERLHEYCINILLIKNGISKEDREKTFKMVSNMSERQLGAFYYLYLNEFGEPPEQISNKKSEFRNKVTHKGVIPTYEQVLEYAEYIFEYIIHLLQKLRTFKDIIKYELQYELDYQYPIYDYKDPDLIPFQQIIVPSMIGTLSGERDFSDKNFNKQFEQLKNRERWLYN